MRVLIFSPHPDDSEFGMGGTLLSLVQNGSLVNVVVITDGGGCSHVSAEQRWIEQCKASDYGKYTISCLQLEDGNIDASECLGKCIEVIIDFQPNIVFAPYPYVGHLLSNHPDHETTGCLVREAVRRARISGVNSKRHIVNKLFYYYVPRDVQPTVYVDITKVMNQLVRLWSCFESQLQTNKRSIEVLTSQRIYISTDTDGIPVEAFVSASPIIVPAESLSVILLNRNEEGNENEHV